MAIPREKLPTASAVASKQNACVARDHYDNMQLCCPSQCGSCFVCLHRQRAKRLRSGTSNFIGSKSVPVCAPSQNGWLLERPQRHHQYVPASSSMIHGFLSKTTGSLTLPSPLCGLSHLVDQRRHFYDGIDRARAALTGAGEGRSLGHFGILHIRIRHRTLIAVEPLDAFVA